MAYLFDGAFKRALYSVKETGRKLKSGAKELVEDFVSGFGGHGWKLWKRNGLWRLELDELLVRRSFTIFEQIISKITAIRGSQTISQGHGKIKSVDIADATVYHELYTLEPSEEDPEVLIPKIEQWTTTELCYRLLLEDDTNTIKEFDFVRCQKNGKYYFVQVGSVFQFYVNIPVTEFDTDDKGITINPPEVGDEIVQFGNFSHATTYNTRHSCIFIHADDDEPAIDLMTDMYTKTWDDAIKIRIGGNLPGTPNLRGFYCVNGMIRCVDEKGNLIYEFKPDGSIDLGKGAIKYDPVENKMIFGSGVKLTWDNLDDDTKVNIKGEAGTSIFVQYSVDGQTDWHEKFVEGDVYMRQKLGDGNWSQPIKIVGEDGEDGPYTDFQFAVNYSLNDAPTEGWEDAPPLVLGGQYLWMRSGLVTPPKKEPEIWTAVRISGTNGEDGISLEVEYSKDGKSDWHSIFYTTDFFMRQKLGDGSWSSPMRIVGETGADGSDGQYMDFQFAKSTSSTTAPTTGWQDAPPEIKSNEYLWMRSGLVVPPATTPSSWTAVRLQGNDGKDGASVQAQYSIDGVTNWHDVFTVGDIFMRQRLSNVTDWSKPMRVVGETGKDGPYTDFQFSKSNSPTIAPTSGWQDAPPVINIGEFLWMRTGIVTPPATAPSKWTTVRIQGNNGHDGADGTDGKDGTSHQYIFTRTTTETPRPETPKTSQEDIYIPDRWTDDPQGVNSVLKYEWSSLRVKRDGLWGDCSIPALWAVYAEDGKDGVDANLLPWIKDWDGHKTQIGGESLISPKIFSGENVGTSDNPSLTGVAIGRDVVTLNGVKRTGLFGIKGNNTTFEIDSFTGDALYKGRVVAGNEDGQRIEISPDLQNIQIYESSGDLAAQFEGNSYTKDDFFGDVPSVTIKNVPLNIKHPYQTEVVISNRFFVKGTQYIDVSYTGLLMNKTVMRILFRVYDGPSSNNIIQEGLILKESCNEGQTKDIVGDNIRAFLQEGYVDIVVSPTNYTGDIYLNTFSCKIYKGAYVSKYFANGIALGTGTDNIFYAIKDSSNDIISEIRNRYNGIKITGKDTYCIKSGFEGILPSIVCLGTAYTTPNNAGFDMTRTFDGRPLSIKYVSMGVCDIVFPNEWKSYSFNYTKCYVMLTGMGTSFDDPYSVSPIKATMKGWNGNGFRVILSDDSSPNDGAFHFEVKLVSNVL